MRGAYHHALGENGLIYGILLMMMDSKDLTRAVYSVVIERDGRALLLGEKVEDRIW